MDNISYAMVPDEGFENESEANKVYFKIYDPETATKAIILSEILIDMDFATLRHFNLIFTCPWEDEHGIWIGIKNGVFDSID